MPRYLLMTVLALAGCSGEAAEICSTPARQDETIRRVIEASTVEEKASAQFQHQEACIHNWAYRLAKSSDHVDDVADAAVTACRDAIRHTARAYAMTSGLSGADLRQFEESEFQDELAASKRKAHFRAVQARAGNCRVP